MNNIEKNEIRYNDLVRQGTNYRNIDENNFSGRIENIIFQKNGVVRIARLSYRKKKKQK